MAMSNENSVLLNSINKNNDNNNILMKMPSIVNSEEEDSFVVLSNGFDDEIDFKEKLSPPLETNIISDVENLIKMDSFSLNDVNNIDCLNTNRSGGVFVDSSSSEEIQKQIEDLIEENSTLKHTFNKNNEHMITMKDQLTKVLVWHEEVQKVYQSHKTKFAEAKSIIDNLKKENDKLKSDLESQKITNEILTQELNKINNKQNQNVSKNDEKDKLIDQLEECLNNIKLENEQIKEENDKIKLNMVKSSDFNAKMIESLEHKITNLTAENQKLDIDLMMGNSKINEMQQNIYQLTSQQVLKGKDADLEENLNQVRQQLLNSQMVVTYLTEEKTNLKLINNKQIDELKEIQNKLELTLQENQTLKEKISELTTNTKLHVTELEKQNQELQEIIHNKNVELFDTFALRTQLDVYKSDFEDEKASCIEIKRERDEIKNDLQQLQKCNQKLQEEIEILRNQRPYAMSPYTYSTRPSTSSTSTSAKADEYSCPKCKHGFKNFQNLQKHIDMCLELVDMLP